jgi:hypothetical protein
MSARLPAPDITLDQACIDALGQFQEVVVLGGRVVGNLRRVASTDNENGEYRNEKAHSRFRADGSRRQHCHRAAIQRLRCRWSLPVNQREERQRDRLVQQWHVLTSSR